MSNTFEFAERLGFSPPVEFEKEILSESFYHTGFTFLNKLVTKFNKGSFVLSCLLYTSPSPRD